MKMISNMAFMALISLVSLSTQAAGWEHAGKTELTCRGQLKPSASGPMVSFEVRVQDGIMTYTGPHILKTRNRYVLDKSLSMFVESRSLSGRDITAGLATAYAVDWANIERGSFASLGERIVDGKSSTAFMLVQAQESAPGGAWVTIAPVTCQ